MRTQIQIGFLLALAAATAGCATSQTGYNWGNYDDALYAHYKSPQDRQAWVASLKKIILQSEQAGAKVPPGIYAEYGFALYEEGKTADAVAYYTREMNNWPESRIFMEKAIAIAQRQPRPGPAGGPSPTGPAGAVEKGTGS
jgi:hypothetical protein